MWRRLQLVKILFVEVYDRDASLAFSKQFYIIKTYNFSQKCVTVEVFLSALSYLMLGSFSKQRFFYFAIWQPWLTVAEDKKIAEDATPFFPILLSLSNNSKRSKH